MTSIGYTPQTDAQIKAAVEKEIDAQIAGSVAPLQTNVDQLDRDRENAERDIGSLFNTVDRASVESADRLRGDYNQALASEQAIMGEATDRLNQLRQQRAAEAQRLAQQVGAPVPIHEFTDPADLEASLFSSASAGSLLKAGGLKEANVAYAESFAGRVLPLLRAREVADTKTQFNKQISAIKAEIAALKAGKSGMVSERMRERQLQEREFALQKATANRDWQLAKKTTAMEAERLRLQATEIYGGEVTYDPKSGTYKPKAGGAPTLAGKELTAAQNAAKKAAVAERETYAYELVEALMTPGVESVKGGKTWMPASGPEAAGAFWNGNQWMVAVNAPDQNITRPPVTNPNQLVTALVEKGIPRALAQKVVGKRFPDWVEGQAVGKPTEKNARPKPPGAGARQFTVRELKGKSPAELIKIARSLGFQQKVPPGIRKYGTKEKRDDSGGRVRNPEFNQKKYNQMVKDFYLYWIQRIYADDMAAGAQGHPGK